jgi:hypothetical protein
MSDTPILLGPGMIVDTQEPQPHERTLLIQKGDRVVYIGTAVHWLKDKEGTVEKFNNGFVLVMFDGLTVTVACATANLKLLRS